MTENLRYNKPCLAHNHSCWTHRNLMREDDYVCITDYKRLPQEYKSILWAIKKDRLPLKGNLSIVVDWLLDHPLKADIECTQ